MAGRRIASGLLVALGLMSSTMVAGADVPRATDAPTWDVTPPRLSYVNGDAAFWRPGAEGWVAAQVNLPLAPGDMLAVGSNGTIEVQVGPRAFVRAAAGTQLALESQEPDFLRFSASGGQLALDVRDLPPGHTVTLGTAHATLTVEQPGYYRVSTSADTTAIAAYRGGRAAVAPAAGNPVMLMTGQQLVFTGAEGPAVSIAVAPELSAWDRWNYQRTDALVAYASARYLPPDVYGGEALDQHGTWRVVETYGPVWVPAAVPSGWAPYTTGRWLWDVRYGWTWLDEAPWGWAPFHYGRWVFVNGAWAWAPGPVVARPVYAPALVAFLDTPAIVEPPVCWVALGWGEPVSPWWGRPGFVGRPWWGGWGGPRVVNNVIINRTTVVNIDNITVYRNMSVRNAVVAVPPQRFARDPVAKARLTHVEVAGLRPRHDGSPPVRPTAASLSPGNARRVNAPEPMRTAPAPALERQGPSGNGRESRPSIPGQRVVTPDSRPSPPGQRVLTPPESRPLPPGQRVLTPPESRPLPPGQRILAPPLGVIPPGHSDKPGRFGTPPVGPDVRVQPNRDQTPGNPGRPPVIEGAKVRMPVPPSEPAEGHVDSRARGRAIPNTPLGDPRGNSGPSSEPVRGPAPARELGVPALSSGRPGEAAPDAPSAERPGRGRFGAPPVVDAPSREKPGRADVLKQPPDRGKAVGPSPGVDRGDPRMAAPRWAPAQLPGGQPAMAGEPGPPARRPAEQNLGRSPVQGPPGRESKVMPANPTAGRAAETRRMPPPRESPPASAVARPEPVGYNPMSPASPPPSVKRGRDAEIESRKQPGAKMRAPGAPQGRGPKGDPEDR